MKMTKSEALNVAMNTMDAFIDMIDEISEDQREKIEVAHEWLTKMKAQLDKPREVSEETKAKQAAAYEKRKAENHKAREELVDKVAPVLRKYLVAAMTAKEVYEIAKNELPSDFSASKVQNILIREMADELNKVEAKGKPNTYQLKRG